MSTPPTPTGHDLAWLHQSLEPIDNGQPFGASPVFASTYHLSGDPTGITDRYGRTNNPTWRALEALLGRMEGGRTVVFPSGMAAACAAILPFVKSGDTVLLPSDGYYTVRQLLEDFLLPLGISVRYVETRHLAREPLDDIALAWIETPGNPGLDLCDIGAFVERSKASGTLVVCDNTTMTPLAQTCLSFGVDMVVSSDTKAVNGHSDTLMGHVSSRRDDLIERVANWRTVGGAIPGPMETWLVMRGLQTLEVRLERMCANALAVAECAMKHPAVGSVRYPGLPADPDHDLAKRQMSSFGSLVALLFADADKAERFLASLQTVFEATSFGGTHSLAERRARWDANNAPGLVRFSAGCEPTASLLSDVKAALDAVLQSESG